MLTLSNFKAFRILREQSRSGLAHVTLIDVERLRLIELRKIEPWFDEAILLSHAMCASSLLDLVDPADLDDPHLNPRHFPADLKHWRSGVRIPLSTAIRLWRRFGLPRPDDLVVSAYTRQLWSVLEATERHPEAPGWCAWCRADIISGQPHDPACAPHNLFGPRGDLGDADEAVAGAPRPARAGKRRGSSVAHGLAALRERLGKTQASMGLTLDYHPNHYSRIERGNLPLTIERATLLVNMYGVTMEEIYGRPGEVAAPDNTP